MKDQYYYAHGKLLLTSEYFVLDGAEALALPTTVGQSLKVKTKPSYQPVLNWKSYDNQGNLWFESDFDFWHFRPIKKQESETQDFLSLLLSSVRKQNPHFLRDEVDVFVETRIEFPLEWGLGSSSSLIYNVAQWAYVSPFELLKNTIGGSGYDIACAQANGPIKFSLVSGKPQWENVPFNPSFKENLYFLYLGKKQSSFHEISKFHKMEIDNKTQITNELTALTEVLMNSSSLTVFEENLRKHERIISEALHYPEIGNKFPDYWGVVKSLGAWGGDFCLVTSSRSYLETKEYFESRNFKTFIPYIEIIRN